MGRRGDPRILSKESVTMDLLARIKSGEARVGIIGLGIRRVAAGRGVCESRLARDRLRRRPVEGRHADGRQQLHPGCAQRRAGGGRERRHLPQHHRPARAGQRRRDRHLRAHAASQDPRPGSLVSWSRRSRRRRLSCARGSSSFSSRRPIRARPKRWRNRILEKGGLKVGQRLLPRVLARACRPGQHDLHDQEHSEGRGRHRRMSIDLAAALYGQVVGKVVPVSADSRRRNGEAARKHVPRGEHRPRQRGGADVPPARASTSGK